MALDFDGTDDEVTHGTVPVNGLSAMSCVVTYQVHTHESETGIVGRSDSVNPVAFFISEDSVPRSIVDIGAANQYGAWALQPLDTWHTVGFVFDGSGAANADRLKVWQNLVAQTLLFTGTIPATTGSPADGLRTGKLQRTGVFGDVTIANLKIWNVALTEAEIIQESDSYRPVRTSGLLQWSPYDDGTSARDYSGIANHGTVTGALQVAGPPVGFGAPVLVG